MQLCERLKKFTPLEVAKLTKLSRGTIMAIRDGATKNPGIETVRKIEEALQILEPQNSAKTDKKQTPSRDNQDAAVAKPGV